MASGGARNRSGPRPDPGSKRSENRLIAASVKVLPAAGYAGAIPDLPLEEPNPRERAFWETIWRTPQATVWVTEPWRHFTIALYVRWACKAELPDATPSTMTQVLRLSDTIGLSPAGLRENGWSIQDSEKEAAQSSPQPEAEASEHTEEERRLRAVE